MRIVLQCPEYGFYIDPVKYLKQPQLINLDNGQDFVYIKPTDIFIGNIIFSSKGKKFEFVYC